MTVPGCATVMNALQLIMSLCADMRDSQVSCLRLHRRLVDLHHEMETSQILILPSDAVVRFPQLVAKFIAHLERYRAKGLPSRVVRHHSKEPAANAARVAYTQSLAEYLRYLERYHTKGLVWRVICHSRSIDELRKLNEEVDLLLGMLPPLAAAAATTSPIVTMQWKPQWEADRLTQFETLNKLVSDESIELMEVKELHKQVEAMTQLKFHLDHHGQAATQSKESLDLIQKLFAVIVAVAVDVPIVPCWFVPADGVEYDTQPFGWDATGSIHQGLLLRHSTTTVAVAVKTLLCDDQGMNEKMKQSFLHAMATWFQLDHPHVVKIIGASHVAVPPYILCDEPTANGNLASFLAASPHNKHRMWELLYQAALGLEYLHSHGIIHGDLTLSKIVVGVDGQAKLAEIGLSAFKPPPRQQKKLRRGYSHYNPTAEEVTAAAVHLRRYAPECLIPGMKPTVASDVYSLGMCILEAASGGLAVLSFLDDEEASALPRRPNELSQSAWSLVQSMARREPSERLPLGEALAALKTLMENAADGELSGLVDPSKTG